MKKFRFTLIELAVAIMILVISIDLVFDFIIGAHRNSRSNDDAYALSLAVESTLNTVNPKNYTLEEFEKVLEAEAKNNSFSKRGISWKISSLKESILVNFVQKGKTIFRMELLSP